MAAPGTNTRERMDSTTNQAIEYWTGTTQSGGVLIHSGFKRILFAYATPTEFISEPMTFPIVVQTDKSTAMLYSTSETPTLVNVMLIGD